MAPPRAGAVLLVAVAAACIAGCSTTKEIFPSNGTVRLSIEDSALETQLAGTPGFTGTPGNQIARWTIQSATVTGFPGVPVFSFLGHAPCTLTQFDGSSADLGTQCAGSRLVVGTTGPVTVTLHLQISHMELRRAWHPEPWAGGDYDGDGVPNESDDCPLIPNPGQEIDTGASSGIACSDVDTTPGRRTIADQDMDGVADSVDDCVWVANPPPTGSTVQADADSDGIGDACEQVAPVLSNASGGEIAIDKDLTLSIGQGTSTTLLVNFNDRQAIRCNGSFTSCSIDPTQVSVTVTNP